MSDLHKAQSKVLKGLKQNLDKILQAAAEDGVNSHLNLLWCVMRGKVLKKKLMGLVSLCQEVAITRAESSAYFCSVFWGQCDLTQELFLQFPTAVPTCIARGREGSRALHFMANTNGVQISEESILGASSID